MSEVNLFGYFRGIKDPRIERTKKHRIETILFISICAVIGGAENWVEVEQFGNEKREWLSRYVDLTHGIPSHDTLGRFFALLNPGEFQKGFLTWVRSIHQKTDGEVIAIDGKTLRRSQDWIHGKGAIHLVHAWASENHMMLGALKTDDKSNEITVIPELLKLLELRGAIITLDAMGTQKEIARQISEGGADYVMALKGNQGTLYEDVKLYWEDKASQKQADFCQKTEKEHGRIDQRKYWITDHLEWLEQRTYWKNLKSIVMVQATRTIQGQTQQAEPRFYLTSLPPVAKTFAKALRGHWGIENGCHWVLDVGFREDESRVRVGHAAENFALLRRIALNLLKQEATSKVGIKAKRLKAGWNCAYLEKVLFKN